MKVAINFKPIDGPWGGGNRFVRALIEALNTRHHTVVHHLNDPDIDLVLMIDPRVRIPNIAFGAGAIQRYRHFQNPRVAVVHRINECDERKNTRDMNFRLRLANRVVDHTVFVGAWLKDLSVWTGTGEWSVVQNGSDPQVFHPLGGSVWNGIDKLRLVTHHWGGNWMKGFDIYSRLDQMLSSPEWSARIEFTYIGNLPAGFAFQNALHIGALDGEALADELRQNHVYVTGSMNEPGSNHQTEGMLCGLPVLYRNSGALPEYCDGYGIMFDGPGDFETALDQMIQDYAEFLPKMTDVPWTAARTTQKFVDLFEDLQNRSAEISKSRKKIGPLATLLNQLPF